MKALILSLLITLSLFGLTVGDVPPIATIDGDKGGLAGDGTQWNSSMIEKKVYVMFYVDPDEKSTNEHFSAALKEKKYDRAVYGSIAIVNLAATWDVGDNASNILIFSKDSKLLFYKSGKMEDADVQKAFSIIENNI